LKNDPHLETLASSKARRFIPQQPEDIKRQGAGGPGSRFREAVSITLVLLYNDGVLTIPENSAKRP